MEDSKDQTIGNIVASDYRTARVFQKFGLDFCCGGHKTVEEAAIQREVDPMEVRRALKELNSTRPAKDYNDWTLDFLIDYIVNTHHRFIREKLPEIDRYLQKVARVHGRQHQELYKVYQ